MKTLKLNVGDVFNLPLENGQFGFGQIVNFPRSKSVFLIGCFDFRSDTEQGSEIEKICQSQLVLLSCCTDAKIYHGDWKIIGNNQSNIGEIQFPYYKIGLPPDEMYLTNFKGYRQKAITPDQFAELNYNTTYSPVRYENALKAHFGMQKWIPEDYDNLTYKEVLRSIEVAESILK